jgi:hypothetical protein
MTQLDSESSNVPACAAKPALAAAGVPAPLATKML